MAKRVYQVWKGSNVSFLVLVLLFAGLEFDLIMLKFGGCLLIEWNLNRGLLFSGDFQRLCLMGFWKWWVLLQWVCCSGNIWIGFLCSRAWDLIFVCFGHGSRTEPLLRCWIVESMGLVEVIHGRLSISLGHLVFWYGLGKCYWIWTMKQLWSGVLSRISQSRASLVEAWIPVAYFFVGYL